MRIGQGFDAHCFRDGDFVMLGGVKVPHHRGLAAHSDGDVLLHALCDALLGAAALGDIGKHFPDTSGEFKGIDSRILLRRTAALIAEVGLHHHRGAAKNRPACAVDARTHCRGFGFTGGDGEREGHYHRENGLCGARRRYRRRCNCLAR